MALTFLSPTVLLVNQSKSDCFPITSWFEANGYNVRQASNILDAMEELTDITLAQRPSMILLNSRSSPPQEFSWMVNSLQTFSEKRDVPIVSLGAECDEKNLGYDEDYFLQVNDFESLKPLMQTLLPTYSQMRKAA